MQNSFYITCLNGAILILVIMLRPYRSWEEGLLDIGNRLTVFVDATLALTVFSDAFVGTHLRLWDSARIEKLQMYSTQTVTALLVLNILLAFWCINPRAAMRVAYSYIVKAWENYKKMNEQAQHNIEKNMLRLMRAVSIGDQTAIIECLSATQHIDFRMRFTTVDGGEQWRIDASSTAPMARVVIGSSQRGVLQ